VGAFRITIDDGTITDARIAFGGMAAIPKRASHCEAVLVGKEWSENSMRVAAAEVRQDFAPISDHRATADYRLKVAENLFKRLYRDITGGEITQVTAI
jgi:xanthine dehydrogenase small subunit